MAVKHLTIKAICSSFLCLTLLAFCHLDMTKYTHKWWFKKKNQTAIIFSHGPKYILTSNKHLTVYFPFLQDSASLKVSLSCTPNELMEQALKKWLTTHGSEDAVWRGQYILRVSQCLEFLGGDHPLIQYKVSGCISKLCLSVCEWLMNFNINLHVSLSGSCTDIADTVFLKCCCCCIVIPIGRPPQLKVKRVLQCYYCDSNTPKPVFWLQRKMFTSSNSMRLYSNHQHQTGF